MFGSVSTEMIKFAVLFLILLASAKVSRGHEKFTIQVNEGRYIL